MIRAETGAEEPATTGIAETTATATTKEVTVPNEKASDLLRLKVSNLSRSAQTLVSGDDLETNTQPLRNTCDG
jgi:hypothetical protein